jgi:hypothetical protein
MIRHPGMKKIIFIILTMIIFPSQLQGQKPLDTLYLKNGSVVYGNIRNSTENNFRMQTPGGSLFIFSKDEVEKFISKTAYNDKPEYERPSGWGFSIQTGLNFGSGNESFFMLFSVTPMVSYTVNPISTVSAGTGLESYEELMLPLFLDYKVNFFNKNVTPFLYVKAGGLLFLSNENIDYLETDHSKGWTFGTGIGYSWPMANFESFVQVGYRHSYTYRVKIDKYGPYPIEYPDEDIFNRFEITWGFKF